MIEAEGEGVLLYLAQEGRGIGLLNKLRAYKLAGGGPRHGRGQRAPRPARRPARLRDRRADPRRPRPLLDPDPDQQPEEDPRPRGLRPVGHRADPDRARAEPPQPRLPAHQARQARPHAAPPGARPRRGAAALRARAPPRAAERESPSGERRATRSSSRASTRSSPSGSWAARSAAFAQAGAHEIDVFDVPGAFELPLAARYAARRGRYAGVACLGAVIRGETDHYDYVCAEAARGIQRRAARDGRAVRVRRAHGRHDGAGARARRRRQARPGAPRRAGRAALAALRAELGGVAERLPPAARRLHCRARWPRYVTAAGRVRRSATAAATRWSPPSGASTRTCRRCGSWSAGAPPRLRLHALPEGRQGHEGPVGRWAAPCASSSARVRPIRRSHLIDVGRHASCVLAGLPSAPQAVARRILRRPVAR